MSVNGYQLYVRHDDVPAVERALQSAGEPCHPIGEIVAGAGEVLLA